MIDIPALYFLTPNVQIAHNSWTNRQSHFALLVNTFNEFVLLFRFYKKKKIVM